MPTLRILPFEPRTYNSVKGLPGNYYIMQTLYDRYHEMYK